MEDRKGKLPLEHLVGVGDYLHDTKTAILLIDKEMEHEHEVLCCVHGKLEDLTIMLMKSLKNNDDLLAIVSAAILNITAERNLK